MEGSPRIPFICRMIPWESGQILLKKNTEPADRAMHCQERMIPGQIMIQKV